MAQTVAFIGLGNMGGPMAGNLVKAGYKVNAFDLAEAAKKHAVELGCSISATPAEAVQGADVIVTMLPSGPIVESVMIDKDALLDKIAKGTLVIDCSTVGPENSRRVAAEAVKRGIRFVDAPVSGGTAGAAAGTLAFMCGGPAEDFAAAKVVLEKMGSNIFHAGDYGAGSVAKICNNMLLAIHMIGTAEALQLGINNGLDPKVLSGIMLKSSGANWSLEKYNPVPGVQENVPSSKNYAGGFMVKLMQKDLGLALTAARLSNSTILFGALASNLYGVHAKSKEGTVDLDFSSILKLYEQH
ncbi:MAG: 3-hydroxyisobutyrate dehydrogenase [Verrucomicrobiaceae bacterium]|nr:3-hydroxyisobutyrate dehydrogenase [Verrucomicrobiaceae bacterium]